MVKFRILKFICIGSFMGIMGLFCGYMMYDWKEVILFFDIKLFVSCEDENEMKDLFDKLYEMY